MFPRSAVQRGALAGLIAALLLPQATLAEPPHTPQGVTAAMVYDPSFTDPSSAKFELRMKFDYTATFWVRVRTSDGGGTKKPVLYHLTTGSAAEYPIYVNRYAPNPNGIWAEWDFVFVGPNIYTNPVDLSDNPNVYWSPGNRAYAPAQPKPAPPAHPYIMPKGSMFKPVLAKLTPDATCRGVYNYKLEVDFGSVGAAGWIKFIRSDGSESAVVPLQSGKQSGTYLTDSFTIKLPKMHARSETAPLLPQPGPNVTDMVSFYDMGPGLALTPPSVGLFPPPAGSTDWQTLAVSQASTQAPINWHLKACGVR